MIKCSGIYDKAAWMQFSDITGSPHTGNIPDPTMPTALSRETAKRGFRLSVESFPAEGFAALFVDAVTRNAAPDVTSPYIALFRFFKAAFGAHVE
jgi:hypothetical protein